MTDLIGPLSEGRTLLALAVLAGIVLAAVGRYLLLLAGLPVPDTAVLAVGGIVGGARARVPRPRRVAPQVGRATYTTGEALLYRYNRL